MAVGVVVAACGPASVRHTVRPGESVGSIARLYGVPFEDVMRANRLRDPARLTVGRRLTIPGAGDAVAVPAVAPALGGRIVPIGFAPTAPGGRAMLAWPVPGGAVTSPFGRRDHAHHDGIDVQAPIGTPVRAAAAGNVVYSGWLRGYGNLVIVDHGGGLATVYGHNRENLVKLGARVRAGQPIAHLGATGQVSGPHLHFEVRKENVARDPLSFLPPMSVASRTPPGEP